MDCMTFDGELNDDPQLVHLGLGAFARSHQAWYTHQANLLSGERWRIIGFTGRSGKVAAALNRQGGEYHLLTKHKAGAEVELIGCITEAHDGRDLRALTSSLADGRTRAVTMTITEAGYARREDGALDRSKPGIADDISTLSRVSRRNWASGAESLGQVVLSNAVARLVLGLEARHRADAGPITVLSCDNLPSNGDALQRQVLHVAETMSPHFRHWLARSVAFPNSSVDRITPATTQADVEHVTKLTGAFDPIPVVAEPFSDWTIAGDIGAGVPKWHKAGARIVTDIEPFEQRKLWLLNGAHTLLAYSGLRRGHTTVDEAVHDPEIRSHLEQWWSDAAQALGPETNSDAYIEQLRQRFENPHIKHSLTQIAANGAMKIRTRVAPVALTHNGDPGSSARIVAEWIRYVLTAPDVVDGESDELARARSLAPLETRVTALLGAASRELVHDRDFLTEVRGLVSSLI